MNNFKQLKTGSDPRTLPDYAALRDELSKLTHPARPDVNWRYAEKRCLSLFEQNGVELQTVAWYTLARTHLAGLLGLNEGLSILEALIRHQWGTLWPQPVHARMEILSSLSQRLQQLMRTLPLNYSDLGQLYRAEQQLTSLGAVLQRLELKHLSQLDTLRTLMHNSASRLENSDGASEPGSVIQPGIVLPATVINGMGTSADAITGAPVADKNEPVNSVKWVYVAQPELQPNVDVLTTVPAPKKLWKPFAMGMFTMLVAGSVAVWGWHYLHRQDPLQAQLAASLAPLPSVLSSVQLKARRLQTPLPEALITETQQQLTRLNQLPPDWSLNYSRQLVQQAQVLWPERAKPLALQWQHQLNAAALPVDAMSGWHQGMTKLQQLSDRLSGLDEQRGKYMTVSELKSVVYSTSQTFNRSVPAEEQLRRYADNPSDIQLRQVEMALEQLQKRYFLLRQEQSKTAVTLVTP
jgi:type VI secretion system protein VasL